MRQVHLDDELAQIEFAKQAAAAFKAHSAMSSYGEIAPGALLALRWGLGEDCVLVLKLDEIHVPTNYANLVRHSPEVEVAPASRGDADGPIPF